MRRAIFVLLLAVPAAAPAHAAVRAGAWEGRTKAGQYVTFDVVNRGDRQRIVRAFAFYRCGQGGAYTTWKRVRIRGGHFAAGGVTSFRGRFRSSRRARGRVDPSPGILGCRGGAKRFKARFAGRRRDVASGDYAGTDSLGNAISVRIDRRGRVLARFGSDVDVECGDRRFLNVLRTLNVPVRVDGGFRVLSRATDSSRFAIRVTGRFAPDGGVTGSYTVLRSHGCAGLSATFSAVRTG